MQLLSIGEAAAQPGVAVGTLRRWHRQGRLAPAGRTIGGHRRDECESVLSSPGNVRESTGKTVCYARESRLMTRLNSSGRRLRAWSSIVPMPVSPTLNLSPTWAVA
jgi:hypothetical protein